MNAHLHTHLVFLVLLRCGNKVSTVDKAKAVTVAAIFVRIAVAKDKRGIVLVA